MFYYIGDTMVIKITFDLLEAEGCESVTDYCRKIIEEDEWDYTDSTIEVYRGDMLCLTVTDIHEAAKLEPGITNWRPYRGKGKKYSE